MWRDPEMGYEMGQCGREAATKRFSQKAIRAAMKGVLLGTMLSRLILKTGGSR